VLVHLLLNCMFHFEYSVWVYTKMMYCLSMFLIILSDIGADVLDLSGSTLELGDKLKLEPVSFLSQNVI